MSKLLIDKSKQKSAEHIEEEMVEALGVNVFKFTSRTHLASRDTIVIPAFSEFGSEMVGVLYSIPDILKTVAQGKYSIVLGWYGREYLYRHLVDEFWELKKEHQWLREYCRAYHHASKNLKKLENSAAKYGRILHTDRFATLSAVDKCRDCGKEWLYWDDHCRCPNLACCSRNIEWGYFSDAHMVKKKAVWVPEPDKEKINYVSKYLKPNSVGITARARKCYGRNFPAEFYVKLITLLRSKGYNPIWMGEESTILPCPMADVTDFSKTNDSRDLETTLALTSQLKFTIQLFTASTRLAGLVGTPYLLVESPDQIFGPIGQEGYRLNLCSKSNAKKIIIADYDNSFNNQEQLLKDIELGVNELQDKKYNYILGSVESINKTMELAKNYSIKIGERMLNPFN